MERKQRSKHRLIGFHKSEKICRDAEQMVKKKKKSAPISIPCRLSIAKLNCCVLYHVSLLCMNINIRRELALCQLQFSVITYSVSLAIQCLMYNTASLPQTQNVLDFPCLYFKLHCVRNISSVRRNL